MDQILVTAATGNVGAPLVKALQRRDMPFEAATRDAENARRQLGEPLNTVYLDYEDASSFDPALEGNDLLFLCGPSGTPNAPDLMMPIVDEAQKHDIKHIVFIASHPSVAKSIKESGINYTFIKANFFMQNFEMYQKKDIRDRDQIFLPCGEGKAAFVHTRDIGETAAAIFSNPADFEGETVKITGPKSMDHFEAASVFTDVLGRDIEYKNPDDETYRRDRKKRGYDDTYINAMIKVFGKIKDEDYATETSPAVEEILGRKPLPLSDYVEENETVFQKS
ncbi:MAG TPA: NmrA family NAD(P)-binding protein [Balneolaceae bacterium]|nr:NmrA family NAD(P)-binding protein [Balneolaceae bacterium]